MKHKLAKAVKKKPTPQPRPPRYPEGVRPVPINSRNVEFVLREYLDKNEPKIQRAIRKMWNTEREIITKEEMEKVLQYSWVPASTDTSHSGLSSASGRGYSSNGFGTNRKDFA